MTQRFDLSGVAGRDLTFTFSLTTVSNGVTVPLNLAGLTPTAYLKASQVTPDTLATVFSTGTGLTVVSSSGGQVSWLIPAADVPLTLAPGSLWYRMDITGSGDPEPAMYGALVLTAA